MMLKYLQKCLAKGGSSLNVVTITRKDLESRYPERRLSKDYNKFLLVNNEMMVALNDKNEMQIFGDTEISEEDEFSLLSALSPFFEKDFLQESEGSKSEEEYTLENKRISLFHWLWVILPMLIMMFTASILYSFLK